MTVSVLICTYGEPRWRELAITRALPSAQAQKDALEVRAFHEPNGTLASVRNAAAREAVGSFLCFLDADDELAPGYVAAMREAGAERSTGALYYPAVQYIYGRREDPPAMLGANRPLTELNRAVIGTLVPRALFLKLGGFKDLPALEDWEMWLRCSRHVPLVPVPEAVYRVRVRAGSRNADQGLYWQIRREFEARPAALLR